MVEISRGIGIVLVCNAHALASTVNVLVITVMYSALEVLVLYVVHKVLTFSVLCPVLQIKPYNNALCTVNIFIVQNVLLCFTLSSVVFYVASKSQHMTSACRCE